MLPRCRPRKRARPRLPAVIRLRRRERRRPATPARLRRALSPAEPARRTQIRRRRLTRVRVILLRPPLRVRTPRPRGVNRKLQQRANRMQRANRVPRSKRVPRKKALRNRATVLNPSPRASRQRPGRAPQKRARPSRAIAPGRRSLKRQALSPDLRASLRASPMDAEPLSSCTLSQCRFQHWLFFCLCEAFMRVRRQRCSQRDIPNWGPTQRLLR